MPYLQKVESPRYIGNGERLVGEPNRHGSRCYIEEKKAWVSTAVYLRWVKFIGAELVPNNVNFGGWPVYKKDGRTIEVS